MSKVWVAYSSIFDSLLSLTAEAAFVIFYIWKTLQKFDQFAITSGHDYWDQKRRLV
jgi:hypothetical protein